MLEMTQEEIEIYEKLIEANTQFALELAKVKEEIKTLNVSVKSVEGFVLGVYKFFKESGSENYQGVVSALIATALIKIEAMLKENNKPASLLLKTITAVAALLSVIFGILLIVLK
jgi:hypothetical protein